MGNFRKWAGGILVAVGVLLIIGIVSIWIVSGANNSSTEVGVLIIGPAIIILVGVVLLGITKRLAVKLGFIEFSGDFFTSIRPRTKLSDLPRQTLDDKTLHERREFADDLVLPDQHAPPFSIFDSVLAAQSLPQSDAMVPMYVMDENFRVIDWNLAFGLAFDRTLEGMRGQSISEWIFYLDNFKEVLEHGEAAFGKSEMMPRIDVEPIEFTSHRYGRFSAVKRSYQIPDDTGASSRGWLSTLDPNFVNGDRLKQFRRDLIGLLHMDLVWSEYSLCYDPVLLNSVVYPELLANLLGSEGPLKEIPPDVTVLDLGAGTGNLSYRLAEDGKNRVIFAGENNHHMLDVLRDKCQSYLRFDNRGPGVLAVKQDITNLYGIPDDSIDYALLNNVAYAIDELAVCLREVRRVLKPGGEIRLSGPQKKTNLTKLLRQIREDLETKGVFPQLRDDYRRLSAINHLYLEPLLHRRTIAEMAQQLRETGFSEILYATDKAYAGQSMLICASPTGMRRPIGRQSLRSKSNLDLSVSVSRNIASSGPFKQSSPTVPLATFSV